MTTIRDIARTARVSVGTVSNYFNNPDLLAVDTRESIRVAIAELEYHPHAAARSLKSKQTHRIGLVPEISIEDAHSLEPGDNAFLEYLSGINTAAAENGFDVLLSAATSTARELDIYERLVGERQVDGLILTGIRPDDERVRLLTQRNLPFVCFGRAAMDVEYAYVDVDGAAGIAAAVNHLARLGHQRIGYITPPAGLACTSQRWEGFSKAMEENNLPVIDELIETGGFTEKAGQSSMHLLLDQPHPPTAVLTANDLCAFGAMRALRARGLEVGKDVSVVGFDDISLAAHWLPPLTTISQPFRELGALSVSLLLQIITGKDLRPHIVRQSHLVERMSTGRVNLI